MTFLTASILEQLWTSRVEKKRCAWPSVCAQVESQILLLREERLAQSADKVHLMLDASSPIAVNTKLYYVNTVRKSVRYSYLSQNHDIRRHDI